MNIFNKKYLYTLFGFIAIIALSFIAYLNPIANSIFFWIAVLTTFFVSIKNLRWGFYIAVAELLIGSQGYLFFIEPHGFWISIRLGIFIALIIAYAYHVIKSKKIPFIDYKHRNLYLLLGGIFIYGIINGVLNNHNLKEVFLDANGYVFFGYIIIIAFLSKQKIDLKKFTQDFYIIITASLTALTLHTLFILYTFSHTIHPWLRPLYLWTRDHRIGEISQLYPESTFHRIFFQNQIYTIFAFIAFLTFFLLYSNRKNNPKQYYSQFIMAVLTATISLISFSRSFWIGLICSLGILGIIIIFHFKKDIKKYFWAIGKCGAILLATILLIVGTMNFPFPRNKYISGSDIFKNRLNFTDEAAVSSRWNLLPVMMSEIKQQPILGYGFAKNIRYQADDPRIKTDENPEGWYTTYSFEWGYLALVLHFGIIGFILLLYVFYLYIKNVYETFRKHPQYKLFNTTIYLILIALFAINVFTPYLNHPLGIGVLLLIQWYSDVLNAQGTMKPQSIDKAV